MKKGTDKCEILKKIRKYVAKKYGLDYESSECTHEGSCMGSCLKCDEELYALQKQLEKKGIDFIASDKTLQKLVEEFTDQSIEEVHDNEIVPGHMNIDKIVDAVKLGVAEAGGVPVVFPAIAVCDGIAMGHVGMKYSLVTRELIADSTECMAKAHQFDALVLNLILQAACGMRTTERPRQRVTTVLLRLCATFLRDLDLAVILLLTKGIKKKLTPIKIVEMFKELLN